MGIKADPGPNNGKRNLCASINIYWPFRAERHRLGPLWIHSSGCIPPVAELLGEPPWTQSSRKVQTNQYATKSMTVLPI